MTDYRKLRVVAFARDYNTCNHIRIRIVAKQMHNDDLCHVDLVDADTDMSDMNRIMSKGLAECDVIWFGRSASVSAIKTIIDSSIRYTLNFDLLTPPYDNMKEVTVEQVKSVRENMQIRTGKRLGFKFQADTAGEG